MMENWEKGGDGDILKKVTRYLNWEQYNKEELLQTALSARLPRIHNLNTGSCWRDFRERDWAFYHIWAFYHT